MTSVIAATHIYTPGEPLFGMIFAAITTVLGLSLVYGGYRLFASGDIDAEHHPKIAIWTVAGIVLVGFVLGLMVLYQFAEGAEHDWSIRVTDGADGGARFEITGVEFTR